jgi:hypothetical protein
MIVFQRNSWLSFCLLGLFFMLSTFILWIFLFLVCVSNEPHTLVFPKDKVILLSFSATVELPEPIQIKGEIEGTPFLLNEACTYQCQFHKFSLFEAKGDLLFSFKRLEGFTCEYHVNPKLSDIERHRLYEVFQVDTMNYYSSEDNSYLQEMFNVVINQKGVIREISLSSNLRNALYKALSSKQDFYCLKELLSSPDRLPPLLAKKAFKKSWTNEGRFFFPILFSSRLTKENTDVSTFETKASFSDKSKSSIGLQGTEITSLDWTMIWDYRRKEQNIKHLSVHFDFGTERTFFSNVANHRFLFDMELDLSFEDPDRAIFNHLEQYESSE